MAVETAFRSERSFSQEEFRAWLDERPPDDASHYELLRGRIVMSPPSRWPHGRIGAHLVAALGSFVRSQGLGIVLDASTGFELPSGDTVEPDVSFVSSERLAAGPRPAAGELVRIVPDLVVEILSPSTRARDLGEKLSIYEESGAREYWAVDPMAHEVLVFVARAGRFARGLTIRAGALETSLLPGLSIPTEEIFAG